MKLNVLEYKGYQGSVEVSVEDNVLHGKILHIVDLVTFEADTPEGLKAAFEEQVEEYLEFCEEEGVEPDKPYKGSFNVRLGPDLHRDLAIAATREGLGINETLKRLVEAWLRDCPSGGFQLAMHHHSHEHFHAPTIDEDTYRGTVDYSINPAPRPEVTLRMVQ